jgi:hypothetical protein
MPYKSYEYYLTRANDRFMCGCGQWYRRSDKAYHLKQFLHTETQKNNTIQIEREPYIFIEPIKPPRQMTKEEYCRI